MIQITRQTYTPPEIQDVARLAQSITTSELEALLSDESLIAEEPQLRIAQALAMFTNQEIETDRLFSPAAARVENENPKKETFVPIFVTNHCQSECAMCGMRQSNGEMIRKFSGKQKIEEQLRILREVDGVEGVGFLTGEYLDKYTRLTNAFYIGWAIRSAVDMGFRKVFFNIGSMTPDEIQVFGEWLDPGDERITMCVFQETYNVERYGRIMGRGGDIPKADFQRRLVSFDNWLDAGFKAVNPGFLVGLHDVKEELVSILTHVAHLSQRRAKIYVSLPRLRPALGSSQNSKVGDDTYLRLISVIAFFSPHTGIVLTTREDAAFQDRVMPLIRTMSPGSPDVAPYQWTEELPNDERSSQFLIPDLRRPRDILSRLTQHGYQFDYFKAPAI